MVKKETSHSIVQCTMCKESPEFLTNRVVLTWSRLILDATDGEDVVIRFHQLQLIALSIVFMVNLNSSLTSSPLVCLPLVFELDSTFCLLEVSRAFGALRVHLIFIF